MKAVASAAEESIWSYFTMPVITNDTAAYRIVQITREARMPIGRSRCGFLASSAVVATTSKPM